MGKRQKAVIIGAGIGGMATSIRLALLGFEVEVFEVNDYPGGKLSELQIGDFRFDAGPSLFTMPHFVEELFQLAQKPISDFFQYQKMDVACRYFYEDGTELTAWGEENKFVEELANKTGENPQNIIRYLKKSRELFELTEHVFLQKSLHRLSTYLSKGTLQSALKLYQLDVFRTMNQANEAHFKSPKLVQFFNRFATYNGSDPYQAPATLNIIPHLEQGFGVFFPKGGMYAITQSLCQLALELGVKFHFGQKVSSILVEGNQVKGVQVGGEKYSADLVVSNMDVVATYRKLLANISPPEWLLKQPKSSSALIFYWGINKIFPQLDLHNILFSQDYRTEFETIFRKKGISHDPTVYLNITSKYWQTDAPKGTENWFVMINVPNNQGQDWDTMIAQARQHVLEKLSHRLDTDLFGLILAESLLEPRSIEAKTSSTQGALYGNSSNNPLAAFLRHPNFSQKLKNLYFCGGSVHPGGGIPLCLLSAKITGDVVAHDFSLSPLSIPANAN